MNIINKLFRNYDPILSFKRDGEDDAFRRSDGTSCFDEHNQERLDEHPDTLVLKKIAFRAMRRIRETLTDEPLADAIYFALKDVENYRSFFADQLRTGNLKVGGYDEEGQPLASQDAIDRVIHADDFDIVNCSAAMCRFSPEETKAQELLNVEIMYLCVALKEIDAALPTLRFGIGGTAIYAVVALDCLRTAEAMRSGERVRRATFTEWGRTASAKRLKNDPRQADKQLIKDYWRTWQSVPTRYRSKAAFARDMVDKSEHLTSQKVVEDWCREWEKLEPNG